MRRSDRQRSVSFRSLPRVYPSKTTLPEFKSNRSLVNLQKIRSVSPIKPSQEKKTQANPTHSQVTLPRPSDLALVHNTQANFPAQMPTRQSYPPARALKSEKSSPAKAQVKLPSISIGGSPIKFIKTLKPAISIPMIAIKRRFKNARKLLRLVPENDFEVSIQDNSPFIGTVLDRNWAKKTEDLSKVVPVYENRWEEDEISSRDEGPTPQELTELITKMRYYKKV